ncbi:hypothetical protein QE152_g11417 [Popillia japonica]|uniref:HTH psq-type domain-containing protein n=1 Tax=Popillia japonica TaxID=7064 RepID=A0AAW1LQL5_POPJA
MNRSKECLRKQPPVVLRFMYGIPVSTRSFTSCDHVRTSIASRSTKRTFLNLSDKVKLIDEIKKGAGVPELATKYGVSKAIIYKIKQFKCQILHVCLRHTESGKIEEI